MGPGPPEELIFKNQRWIQVERALNKEENCLVTNLVTW
jgi:hypothetical protein